MVNLFSLLTNLYYILKEKNNMTSKLNEIATICGKNGVEMSMLKSEHYDVHYFPDEKKLVITFSDYTDDKFQKMLSDKLEELKEMFK